MCRYPPILPNLKPRLLFRYPQILLGKNQDCYSDILYFYRKQIRTTIQISSAPTWTKTKTAIHISSISTWHKSGLQFRYPLLQPSLRIRMLSRYPLFLLAKNQDCYSDILYFYLTQIRTAVHMSSIMTPPKIDIAISISSVSTWQKSRLLFKYPLFLPDTNRVYSSNILCSYPA